MFWKFLQKKTESYSWFKISPFPSSVGEKYDEQKDNDLHMLCHNIPDVLFMVFKLPVTGLTMWIRIPTSYRSIIESIKSFGVEYHDGVIVTKKIDALVKFKFAKNFVYPLVYDKTAIESNIFSVLSDSPYGVFGIKLRHAPSKPVTKQYESMLNKKKRNENKGKDGDNSVSPIHVDPYEKMAKQKSECTSFFYSEIFFGVDKISHVEEFMKVIPYTSQHIEPNRLIRAKIVTSKEKNLSAAIEFLEKVAITQCNSDKKTILSGLDILPFVRFPESPQIFGLESAKSPTMASDSVDEREFNDVGGFHQQ